MMVPRVLPVLLLLATSTAMAQQSAPDSVTLQPGDLINVQIWREPDLSGSFVVDEHGVVVLPLLGERPVTDIPLERLRELLADEYRVHLRNPSISILPLRKVLVLGAVRTPGPYEVNPIETVIGVIAQAGGVDGSGRADRVTIIRNGHVLHSHVPVESTVGSLRLRSGDQIMVGQRSWLARNQSLVISVLIALPSAIFTITRIIE